MGSIGFNSNSQLQVNGTPLQTGFKNYIINGDFGVWQRGTSQTASGYGSDDRWGNANIGTTKVHELANPLSTEIDSINGNFLSKTTVTSVAGASNYCIKTQKIEDVTKLSGKTVTLSFWAKADAHKNIAIEFSQHFGTGGSPSATIVGIGVTKIAITTVLTKYSVTVSIPSVSDKTLGTDGINTTFTNVLFWFDAGSGFNARTDSLGQQSGTFYLGNVQLEDGTVATPFEQRPYGLELSLCQRYYEVLGVGIGVARDSTLMILHFSSAPKRIAATALLLNSSPYGESPINITPRNGISSFIGTQMNQNLSSDAGHILSVQNFSGMTAGASAALSAGQISLSAEL